MFPLAFCRLLQGAQNILHPAVREQAAGSEGFGISRLVKQHCDMNVVLPMTGHVTSLNASVATAVILYQVYNSRHPFK